MADEMILRSATPADLGALDDLLARSYPRLLAPDYPPSVMVLALPIITRARPELLASGRYFVVQGGHGRLLSAGGYSRAAPTAIGPSPVSGVGHIRHVVTDPDATRRGLGRRVMRHVLEQATAEGITGIERLSTRTAVPFYRAMGFVAGSEVDVPLGPGITFPAVRMQRVL